VSGARGALQRTPPTACDACLRRALFLKLLASFIEPVVADRRGSRCAELLRLDNESLARAVAPRRAAGLLAEARELDPSSLRAELAGFDGWACCRHDAAFPEALRDAADGPAALLARGEPDLLRGLRRDSAVTIVGARRASAYGTGVARDLAGALARTGLTVISGMANGIDSAAHEGALDAGGATIAVLGGGPEVPYPRRRTRLYRRILERNLVVSELPPGTGSWRWIFPARNRIMAALGRMTVVVEAAERSGSLITAEMAGELGRDVGAVPGPVNSWLSAGANRLLHTGAAVVRDAQDVLDEMLGPGRVDVAAHGPPLEPALAGVLALLAEKGATCDAIAVAARLPPAEAAARLARLELLGYARGDASGRYFRTLLRPGA
jgi:DNA processing protein